MPQACAAAAGAPRSRLVRKLALTGYGDELLLNLNQRNVHVVISSKHHIYKLYSTTDNILVRISIKLTLFSLLTIFVLHLL
jgi:hypothetical protein